MTYYSETDKQSILDQSREILERWGPAEPSPVILVEVEDRNARWAREGKEIETERRKETVRRRLREKAHEQQRVAGASVLAAALKAMGEVITVVDTALDLIEQRVAAIEKRTVDLEKQNEVRELCTEIKKLRSQMIEDIPVLPKFNQ
jgi:hypothetical protein